MQLWHYAVLALGKWTLGYMNWWKVLVEVALIAMLSLASYCLVETPLRRRAWVGASTGKDARGKGGRAARRSCQTILIGGLAVSVVLSVLIVLLMVVHAPLYDGMQAAMWQPLLARILGAKPLNLPKFKNVGKTLECHVSKTYFRGNEIPEHCITPADPTKRTLFVLGDSHATNHVPSLQEAAKNMTGSSALQVRYFVDNQTYLKFFAGEEGTTTRTHTWDDYAKVFAEHMKAGDMMAFSWFRGRTTEGEYKSEYVLPRKADGAKLARLGKGLRKLNTLVKSKNATLLLVDDVPFTCRSGVSYESDILAHGQVQLCSAPKAVSRQDRQGLTDLYKTLEREEPNVIYVDFHDALCDGDTCDLFDRRQGGGKAPRFLYGDTHSHFTTLYPDPLANEWRDLLEHAIIPGLPSYNGSIVEEGGMGGEGGMAGEGGMGGGGEGSSNGTATQLLTTRADSDDASDGHEEGR